MGGVGGSLVTLLNKHLSESNRLKERELVETFAGVALCLLDCHQADPPIIHRGPPPCHLPPCFYSLMVLST